MKLKEITQEQFETHLTDLLTFIGVKHWPENNAIVKTVEILRSQFGHITDEQMMEAASLYAAGRINGFDHFNEFTPAFMGKLMTAMEKRLKEEGKLVSVYDQQRQFEQVKKPTGTKCDWADYLNDLYLKFKRKELQPITLFIPLPTYEWCVDNGRLQPDDWTKYSSKASDTLAGQRKMKSPEFMGIGTGMVVSTNAQTEAKKMAVLELLTSKL